MPRPAKSRTSAVRPEAALTSLRAAAAAGGFVLSALPGGQYLLTPVGEKQGRSGPKARVPEAERMRAVEDWDPFAEGRRLVAFYREEEGGALDRRAAAGRLDLSLAQLYNRVKQRKVVVWTDGAGRLHFPAWQFGASGMLPGVADCLRHLGRDSWGHMRFFLTPAESAGGKTPLELLRGNRIREAVDLARQTRA